MLENHKDRRIKIRIQCLEISNAILHVGNDNREKLSVKYDTIILFKEISWFSWKYDYLSNNL